MKLLYRLILIAVLLAGAAVALLLLWSNQPLTLAADKLEWNIEKNGELVARKNYIGAKNLKFVQGYQEIVIATENEEDNNASHINIDLKNILLGDFIAYVLTDPKIQGVATGKIRLNNVFDNLSATSQLKVEQFR